VLLPKFEGVLLQLGHSRTVSSSGVVPPVGDCTAPRRRGREDKRRLNGILPVWEQREPEHRRPGSLYMERGYQLPAVVVGVAG